MNLQSKLKHLKMQYRDCVESDVYTQALDQMKDEKAARAFTGIFMMAHDQAVDATANEILYGNAEGLISDSISQEG